MLKKSFCLAASAALLFSVAIPSFAHTPSLPLVRAAVATDGPIKNKEAGVQFSLPAGWHAEPDGEAVLVTNEDKTFTAVLAQVGSKEIGNAEDEIDKEIAKFLSDVHQDNDDPIKLDFNGIQAFQKKGSGKIKNTDVEVYWTVNILMSTKPVFLITYAVRSEGERILPKVKQFIASIGPVE